MNLTEEQLQTLRHMLGIDKPDERAPEPYRDYYCASRGDAELADSERDADLVLLRASKEIESLRTELAECKRDNERLHVAMCQSCVCLNNGETYRGHQIIRAALAKEE